jgi:hypothetical protein
MESQSRDENPGHFNGVNCSIGKHVINIQFFGLLGQFYLHRTMIRAHDLVKNGGALN